MNQVILVNLRNLPKMNKNIKLSKNIYFLYKLKNKYGDSIIELRYVNNKKVINSRTSPW
uniref:Uncharacterized protein n=1 Tax=viral metagenome TaxID=1070528 RepID=A0A6C0CY42_9ZZZZ